MTTTHTPGPWETLPEECDKPPELLELVMLANDGVRGSHTVAWQQKARAAIAKATGAA